MSIAKVRGNREGLRMGYKMIAKYKVGTAIGT